MAKIYGNPITFGSSKSEPHFELVATFPISESNLTNLKTVRDEMNVYVFRMGTFKIPFPLQIKDNTYNSMNDLKFEVGPNNILFSANELAGQNIWIQRKGILNDEVDVLSVNTGYVINCKLLMFVKFEK